MNSASPIFRGALAIGALVIIAGCIWYIVIRPSQMSTKAAQADAGRVEAVGDSAKAGDAQRIVIDLQNHAATTDAVTRSNDDAIRAAPGATDTVPPAVNAAGLNAICLRPEYRHQPACVALLGADPA